MKNLLLALCVLTIPLHADEYRWTTPAAATKTINAYLQIRDYYAAAEAASAAAIQFGDDRSLEELKIKALSKSGKEKEMLRAWKQYEERYQPDLESSSAVEDIAWGIIANGARSTSPVIRLISFVAAFFAEDARGINIIRESFNDSNSVIRRAVVQLSSQLLDDPIREGVYGIFKQEKVWSVKIESIRAVGKMRIKRAHSELLGILSKDSSSAEDKAAAIEALAALFDTANREELKHLVKSDRAGLRLLACKLVGVFELHDSLDLIIPLLKDHCADVRVGVLETLGILRVHNYQESSLRDLLEPSLNHQDPLVAITAAWVLTLHSPEEGQAQLERWLGHRLSNVRVLASGALAACGKYGMPLLTAAFKKAEDPYVRMNLALGMIGQRVNVGEACEALYDGLQSQPQLWMWEEKGRFRILASSDLRHDAAQPHYPEAADQEARLEVLNALAILNYPKTQQAMRQFLSQRNWHVTDIVSALLLTEGDDSSIDLVQQLLDDPDPKIQVQAALVLAQWGGGEAALKTLEQAYRTTAQRELKEKILEGICQISSRKSLPFLVKRWEEPSQLLRLIAALGVIRCLAH